MMPMMSAAPPVFGAELDEDLNPIDPRAPKPAVVFLVTDNEQKEPSMAARVIKAAEENPPVSIKVKVIAPFRVIHAGVAYTDGDVLEVPNDDEHKAWVKSRWVELVEEKK